MEHINLSGISVLIVDANPLLRTVFRQVLRELGAIDVEAVSSPELGFKKFNEQNPDIVLIDWGPGCDGMALLRNIRTHPSSANPYAPVIITSAHTDQEHVLSARDRGMSEYLAKPVSAKTLYHRIARIAQEERVFVRSDQFFGPDRRRRASESLLADRRVTTYTPRHAAEASIPPAAAQTAPQSATPIAGDLSHTAS